MGKHEVGGQHGEQDRRVTQRHEQRDQHERDGELDRDGHDLPQHAFDDHLQAVRQALEEALHIAAVARCAARERRKLRMQRAAQQRIRHGVHDPAGVGEQRDRRDRGRGPQHGEQRDVDRRLRGIEPRARHLVDRELQRDRAEQHERRGQRLDQHAGDDRPSRVRFLVEHQTDDVRQRA
ncbi:hypothetical protein DM77_5204 [Burkholderia mallei]|nr:hypothetical protein DM46_5117 [Burkholderia mallei]KOT17948.1 hypothetical protein DM77_5204 [Burkholderia mallei]KOT25820.1 hypothetical protein DM52_4987 [Burkholderia mallei]